MKGFLLPFRCKWIGASLVLLGLAGLVYYLFFNFILILPVFAVYSAFFETKILEVIRTNVADELIMVTLLTGFFLLAFSKEKGETESLDQVRLKAFMKAIWVNSGMLLFLILFFFGQGFLIALLINLYSFFIFYLIFFFFEKRRTKKDHFLP